MVDLATISSAESVYGNNKSHFILMLKKGLMAVSLGVKV